MFCAMENISNEKSISNSFILQGPKSVYEPGKGGLGYEIFRSLNLNKGKVAQISISTGKTDSYEDLLLRCIRVAIFLSRKKLSKDDIVCLCSGNDVDSIVPFISSTFVRSIYASIEPSIHDDDVVYLLNYIKPKILFVSEEFEEKIEACLHKSDINCEMIIIGKSIKNINFLELLVPSEEENNFQPVFVHDLRETVVIFLSSGTTGNSKGICLNHYSLLAQVFNLFHTNYRQGRINLSNFFHKYDDSEETKFLFYSPMYWITGTMLSLGLYFSGGTKILGSTFSGEIVWKAIEKYQPNTIFFPFRQANEICLYGIDKEPNTTLRGFIISAGAVSDELMKKIQKCFLQAKVLQCYGQTENSGLLTGFNIDDSEDARLQKIHPDSCGKIFPTFQMKVVDIDNEQSVGLGMQGELRVKSKYIMNGYHQMDSSSAFDSDGWFKTGDLVYFDEDQCLHIIDRVKDILNYAFHWIQPSVIEKILSQHPAVLENFVFGYPHPKNNEHAMAVVLLKEGFKNKVSEDEIIAFVNERVPNDWYKIRAGIKFVDKMLKTANGKLKKIDMKRSIIAEKN